MFDIGFWELLLIGVLGLLVLGPERLPRVARTVGLWAGRARGYVRQLSQELDRELQASELKQDLERANTALGEAQTNLNKNLNKGLKDARLEDPKKPGESQPQDSQDSANR